MLRVLTACGLAALVVTGAAPAAAAPPTPVTDHCPHRVRTPPAVDASEVVSPGSTTPTPLPVPTPPVGGAALSGCGVIADPSAGPIPQRLTSAAWLIADVDSGHVIAAKDPHGRYRPASTIKVLLALVALRDLHLDDVVEPTVEDWSTEGDSCGMGPGGHYTTRDLLTGLLMVSGNDCANALSRSLGGTEATLAKMNELAASLGAHDTRAASPSGLDAAGMSTSPYDMALFFRAALRDNTFRELIGLRTFRFPGYPPRADVPGDKPHPAYDMYTSNHLLLEDYPGMIGGKTGYTDDALKTFVGTVHRDGRTIMVVQMYGLSVAGDMYWDQAKSMFDYGFRSARTVSVGSLVDPTPSAAASTTPAHPDVTQRAGPSSDSASSTSLQILIGLVAALVAVCLLLLGLRFLGAKKR